MALVLEIEYLAGVSFAALGPDTEAADWPPQPDRVFSALVATWGAHGEPDDERSALAWLEAQDAPMCEAAECSTRTAPAVFVPPNDARTDRAKTAAGVLPALRSRQPRRFPAARPQWPVVRHVWHAAPDAQVLAALVRLARDTSYLGHSSSLTRCRFAVAEAEVPGSLAPARRRIYRGRLDELRAAHARFQISADRKDRPAPGAPTPAPELPTPISRSAFASRWLVLEHLDGTMPDLRASALVARAIRKTLMSGYGQLGEPVPAFISGHEPDGSPTSAPHIAIVPLAFVGSPYADGRVLGFALVSPAAHDLLRDELFLRVLRKVAPQVVSLGRRVIEVRSPAGTGADAGFALALSPTFEPGDGRRSLDPAPYVASASAFATVTPIVLDRHLKRQGAARDEEIAKQICTACINIGLPAPELVVPHKHAAVQGAPSAWPPGRAPAWLGWRLPASLAHRQLTHALVRFAEPVEGPLLLGAGRFLGLGLCRPLNGGSA